MNYTFHQLQVFLKIAETQSITKAAGELHLTQPAVSMQFKKLQDQFDIPLAEVVGRKIYITDFGKEIAAAAENIINQVYAINYKTLAYKGQLSGRMKISIVSTGKYIMPYFLSEFLKKHPGIELQMVVTNKSGVLKSMENNEVDFSLVSIVPDTLQVEKLDLLQNKLFLVGREKLVVPKSGGAAELFRDLPLIFREPGSGTRQTMERFLEERHIPFRKIMELSTNEAVKQALLASMGFSIMPLIGIKNELQNGGLHIIPVKGLPIKTTWSLIWMKGKNHSPSTRSFLEYVKKAKSEIVKTHFDWYEEY